MRQCGFSVAAFSLDMGRMNITREVIDDGYNAETFRSAYGNNDFRNRPLSIGTLEEDTTLLPPKPVQKKAGRPKGKQKRKRTNVIGEYSTSSKYNGAVLVGAGATAGKYLSQPTLSQQT